MTPRGSMTMPLPEIGRRLPDAVQRILTRAFRVATFISENDSGGGEYGFRILLTSGWLVVAVDTAFLALVGGFLTTVVVAFETVEVATVEVAAVVVEAPSAAAPAETCGVPGSASGCGMSAVNRIARKSPPTRSPRIPICVKSGRRESISLNICCIGEYSSFAKFSVCFHAKRKN